MAEHKKIKTLSKKGRNKKRGTPKRKGKKK